MDAAIHTRPLPAQAAGQTASRRYAWYVVGLLSMGHLVSFIDRFVMSLVLTPLKAEMHLSDGQLGMVQGLGFVILYSVAGIPIGRLADVVSRRGLIAVGMLIWSLATAACAFAHTYNQLFAARLMVGFGEAALVPAAMSLISGYFDRTEVARPVSTFTMGAPIGKTLALVGGAWLLGLLVPMGGLTLPLLGHFKPWQGLFLAASLPGLLLIPFLLTIGNPPRNQPSAPGQGAFAAVLRHIGAHFPAYALHITAACASILLVQAFGVWAPSFFTRLHGLTVAQSGYVVGLATFAASPLGNLFGGWLTTALQRRGVAAAPLVVIGLSLLGAIPLALALIAAPSLPVAAAAFGVLTFVLSCTSGPALSGIQSLTPPHQRGAATAVYMCIMTVVSVGLGPTLVGFLSDDVFGGGKGLGFALMATTVIVSAIGTACAALGRRTFERSANS
jgi:MFS family permease